MSVSGLSRSTLSRFTEDESPLLNILLPINRLGSFDICSTLSTDLEKHGKWNSFQATTDLPTVIPHVKGLYMFVWRPPFLFQASDGQNSGLFFVLYIGKAEKGGSSIKKRFEQDYVKCLAGAEDVLWRNIPDERNLLLEKWLALKPLEYWYLEIPEEAEIHRLEKRLTRLVNPPINKQNKHKATKGGETDAFAKRK